MPKNKKNTGKGVEELSMYAIRRLARKAAVKRMDKYIYDVIRIM